MGLTGQRADNASRAVGLQGDLAVAAIESGQDPIAGQIHEIDDRRHVEFAGNMRNFDPPVRGRRTLLLDLVTA